MALHLRVAVSLLLVHMMVCFQKPAMLRLPGMRSRTSLRMSGGVSSIRDVLGLLPLCIEPSSKTTTVNDPTAGMSVDQIANYMDNVGGGMCGYPEWIRDSLGLGLNLSLIGFGVLTLSYVVLAGLNFTLEKQVEDLLKPAAARLEAATGFTVSDEQPKDRAVVKKFVPSALQAQSGLGEDSDENVYFNDDDEDSGAGGSGGSRNKIVNYKGSGSSGESRAARRLKEKLRKDNKD